MRLARPAVLLATALLAAAAFPPEAEQVYDARFKDITTNGRGELSRYEPLEAVRGVARHKPLPLAAKPTIAPAALAEARAYAAANNSSAFMVWHDGKVQDAAYFGGRTAATPIVSKSLAKPLTAIAIGRALALGKLSSLDQPVTDFIPEWKGTPKAQIRLRHLLDMRSGLLAQGFSMDPKNPWSRAYLHPYHEKIIVAEYPLTDPPGTKYEYNNATSELVALVIERATGRRYADFIGREVLAPIGAAGGEVWVNRPGGLAHSGCCIMLPPETWLRLGILLIDDGRWSGKRLLPAGYVAAMRTATRENPHYGLGLWIGTPYVERRGFANPARPGPKVLHSEPFLADDLFMFDGNSNQVVYIVPSRRLIVLRTGDNPPKSPEWDNSRLPNLLLRALGPSKA